MPEPLIPTAIAKAASALTGDAKAEKKKAARALFEGAWYRIRDELLEHFTAEGMPQDAREWYRQSLEHNVPGGKLNRGMSVVDTLAILKGSDLTEEEYFRAAALGWCIELLQAYFLVADDMMDQSFTRRGQPCWFRVPKVGNIAINDAFMINSAIYNLLKKHFRKETYYIDLVELFHDVTYKTEMGQLVDLITAPEDLVDLNRFSLEKHRLIVIYKTAYYSFYLPVALAMLVHGIPAPAGADLSFPLAAPPPTAATVASINDPYRLALDILIPLGEYFQVQDDVLDYSGTPEQIGKVGTDIFDNKCSWPVNLALSLVTPEQRALLDANYGRKDKEAEAKVKALYKELGILERYQKYEEDSVGRIRDMVNTIPANGRPDGLKREVFTSFVDKIYKRTK